MMAARASAGVIVVAVAMGDLLRRLVERFFVVKLGALVDAVFAHAAIAADFAVEKLFDFFQANLAVHRARLLMRSPYSSRRRLSSGRRSRGDLPSSGCDEQDRSELRQP